MASDSKTTASHVAARMPVGSLPPTVVQKRGIEQVWQTDDKAAKASKEGGKVVYALGAACSEIFTGANLAELLRSGHELEAEALSRLAADQLAPPLVQHSSCSRLPQLGDFISTIERHLPGNRGGATMGGAGDDWCVNLQLEGSSAVSASIEMCLQLQAARGNTGRTCVAVGERSYHGPATSTFGVPYAPQSGWQLSAKPSQLIYPMPSPFRVEGAAGLEAEWDAFFEAHGEKIGVLVFEPQSGSSCSGAPWDPVLLKSLIERARRAGCLLISDEVMCGLGRHGLSRADTGNDGTVACFLADAWDLDVDAVTFGKAVAGGVFPLSGSVLLRGASEMSAAKRNVVHCHTYAGASPRALLAATGVLERVGKAEWGAAVRRSAVAVTRFMKAAADVAKKKRAR